MQQANVDLIVMEACKGNSKAFAMLYQHFYASSLRFAYKHCGDQQLAQDAVQDAWLNCARSIRKLHDPAGFRSWLFQTVRWRLLDALRKNQRHESMQEYDTTDAAALTQTARLEHSELRVLISQLPEVERMSIHLFYLEQFSLKEIATVLAVPIGTVKSRLNRAREHLRQQLEK